MSIARTAADVNITAAERARRRCDVDAAAHSSEMEGLRSSAEFRIDAEAYVDGTIDADELVARTRARYGVG
ncbi:antitoxin VbhA family protein [Microbacteriaceae bacterium VKM Ac-2854]|nr:antitoxin VbhA family protein [Microbacteriaceae bacterium VKM Ac-2854]